MCHWLALQNPAFVNRAFVVALGNGFVALRCACSVHAPRQPSHEILVRIAHTKLRSNGSEPEEISYQSICDEFHVAQTQVLPGLHIDMRKPKFTNTS